MVTITIHDVPDDRVARIKRAATENGRTIEQEVRELLIAEYSSQDAATDNEPRSPTCSCPADG